MKVILIVALTLVLSGCGQSGSLYLPESNPASGANASDHAA